MPSAEEVKIRMGLDANGLIVGTNNVLDKQKRAASEYATFWESAVAKKDAIFASSASRELALIKKTEEAEIASLARRERAAEEAYKREAQAQIDASRRANDEINRQLVNNDPARQAIRRNRTAAEQKALRAGSGAYGSGSTAGMMAQEAASGGSLSDIGHTAEGVAVYEIVKKSTHAIGNAKVFTELQVLLHESIAGRWKQFVSSFSRLLGFMGLTAETLLTGIPIIGAGVAGIIGNWKMRGSLHEQGGAYGSNEALKHQDSKLFGELRNMVENLSKAGKLGAGDSTDLLARLSNPSTGNINFVQRRLMQLFPKGMPALKKHEDPMVDADKAYEKSKKQLEELNLKAREQANLDKDILDRQEKIKWLKRDTTLLDEKSLQFHQDRAELLALEVQQQKDITEQKRLQKEADKADAVKTKEWQAWSRTAAKDYMRGKIYNSMDEAEFPTIEQLAGRSFTKRLNNLYGERVVGRGKNRRVIQGQYDLEDGDGPLASTAQDFLLAQKQQVWDRVHGNSSAAEQDRLRMVADRTFLISHGAASPQMVLSKIGEDTDKLRLLFDALVTSGVIIKGTE